MIYFRRLTKEILQAMLEIGDEQAILQYLTNIVERRPAEDMPIVEGVVKELCPHLLSKWHKVMMIS